MERPTILMATRLPEAFVGRLRERYTVLGPLERSSPDALPQGAGAVRGLITMGSLPTDRALIDALPNLGIICCYGTGYEGVDRAYASARGIALGHAGDANASAVADFALGLILAATRGIAAGDRFVRAGRWKGNSVERMPTLAGLGGRRVGIYGLGAIGSRIARRAEAFETEIGYHGRTRRPDVPYLYHDDLLSLADWADILVVAVRAGADNRHAVDARVLRALGPEACLVNISRGIAVDEDALCEALERGWIATAGLDVFHGEPHVSPRLRALDNVVLTPHVGGNSWSAQKAQQDMMMRNLEAFFIGAAIPSPIPS